MHTHTHTHTHTSTRTRTHTHIHTQLVQVPGLCSPGGKAELHLVPHALPRRLEHSKSTCLCNVYVCVSVILIVCVKCLCAWLCVCVMFMCMILCVCVHVRMCFVWVLACVHWQLHVWTDGFICKLCKHSAYYCTIARAFDLTTHVWTDGFICKYCKVCILLYYRTCICCNE